MRQQWNRWKSGTKDRASKASLLFFMFFFKVESLPAFKEAALVIIFWIISRVLPFIFHWLCWLLFRPGTLHARRNNVEPLRSWPLPSLMNHFLYVSKESVIEENMPQAAYNIPFMDCGWAMWPEKTCESVIWPPERPRAWISHDPPLSWRGAVTQPARYGDITSLRRPKSFRKN